MATSSAFETLTARLGEGPVSYILAELNDLLSEASGPELEALPRPTLSDPYLSNYVAAMIELAAHRKQAMPPAWTADIAPLERPVFGVPWQSLRAHLLVSSPIPFRRRNIFIDSSIGARV